MKSHATFHFAIFQAARQGVVATLLMAALVGCSGPGTPEAAGSGAPLALSAHAEAYDSAPVPTTTPAPAASATQAPAVDTATARPAAAKPLGKPRTALPQAPLPALAAVPTPAAAPAPESTPVATPEPDAAAVPATRTQAGRVLDETGRPLIGATVMLKGSSKGTSTDANGNYTLEVPGGNDTFVVGYGGYTDEVATSHDGQPLNVTLVPDPNSKVKNRRARR